MRDNCEGTCYQGVEKAKPQYLISNFLKLKNMGWFRIERKKRGGVDINICSRCCVSAFLPRPCTAILKFVSSGAVR